MKLKNRVAMAPMNMVYSDPDGYNSEQWLAWYAARAKGGFGLIITDATVVNPVYLARFRPPQYRISSPTRGTARGLGMMADHIHAFGAKVFIQLSPASGARVMPRPAPHQPAGAPSAIPIRSTCATSTRGGRGS